MHAVTIGQGDTAALMLHCSLATHRAIVPLAKALPNLTATCVDLLGHGASPDPVGPNDFGAGAKAASQVWDGPGWVIGHSFGGAVAMRFALDYPERVTRLILIEPVLFKGAQGTEGYAKFEQDFGPISQAFDENDMETAARSFTAIWDDKTAWDDVPKRQRQYLMDRIYLIRDSDLDVIGDSSGIFDAGVLERLDVPVTLIQGANTHPIITATHDTLASRLPHATSHVIAGAGHMAPITHASDVADVIRAA